LANHLLHSNQSGKKAEEYASILRIAKGNVYRIVQHYNNKGKDFNRELHWG